MGATYLGTGPNGGAVFKTGVTRTITWTGAISGAVSETVGDNSTHYPPLPWKITYPVITVTAPTRGRPGMMSSPTMAGTFADICIYCVPLPVSGSTLLQGAGVTAGAQSVASTSADISNSAGTGGRSGPQPGYFIIGGGDASYSPGVDCDIGFAGDWTYECTVERCFEVMGNYPPGWQDLLVAYTFPGYNVPGSRVEPGATSWGDIYPDGPPQAGIRFFEKMVPGSAVTSAVALLQNGMYDAVDPATGLISVDTYTDAPVGASVSNSVPALTAGDLASGRWEILSKRACAVTVQTNVGASGGSTLGITTSVGAPTGYPYSETISDVYNPGGFAGSTARSRTWDASGGASCAETYTPTGDMGAVEGYVAGMNMSVAVSPDRVVDLVGQIAEFDQAEHPGALNVLDSAVLTSTGFGVAWRDVATDASGAVSTSDTQKYHVIRGGPSAPADVDTFVRMQAAIDPASLAATNDDPLDTRIPFHGEAFGSVSVSQAASVTIEDVAHSNDGAGGDISIDLFVDGSLGINCGNPPGGFNSKIGVFDVDQDFTGGVADSSFYNPTGYSGSYVDTSQVYGANQQIYLTSRQGVGTGSFTYTIPGLTPSSSVNVRLHFSENHNVSAGQRLIDVTAQGAAILTNFDIVAAAGAIETAVARTFPVTVDVSGNVVLVFSPGSGSLLPCQVNAIEIVANAPLINCGDPGDDAFPDINFSGGATASTTAHLTDLSWVDRPLPQRMYQTARTGVCSYTRSGLLPSALYCVRLHFCDFQSTHAGDRVFDVKLNSATVESGLDLVATAGAPKLAYAVQHVVRSSAGGVILIELAAGSAGSPIINGIEISRLYDWSGYRYADIVVNDSTLGSQPMLLKLGSKQWTIHTTMAATDVTRTIDLCSPDNRDALLAESGVQLDSQWPLPAADDIDPLWGVSVAWNITATSLATGTTFQIKSITLKRVHDCLVTILPADQAWVPDGWGNQVTRGIVATTDGRQSLEQEYMQRYMLNSDGTHTAEGRLYHKRNGEYLYRQLSIAQMVHRIGMQLGWSASYAGGDDFHNQWRPWVWAMGGSALWDGAGAGAWDSPFYLDGAAGISVSCQALWDFVSDWYPDIGDPFSSVGGSMPCRFFKRLRGNVWGLALNHDGTPDSGQIVQAENGIGVPSGTGTTNAWGFYRTGTAFLVSQDFLDWENDHPIGAEPRTTLPYADGNVQLSPTVMGLLDNVVIRSRKSTRAGFILPTSPEESLRAPWNCEHPTGLIRSAIASGFLRWWHTWAGLPPWKHLHNLPVTTSDLAVRSRMAVRPDRTIIHLVELAAPTGGVHEIDSNNDGRTWGTASLLFAGAAYPGVAVGESGVELRWAVSGGAVVSTLRQPGGVMSGTLSWVDGATGSALAVADDTFQVLESRRPGRPWLAHLQIVGDTNTSLWRCMSDARAASDGHLTWRKLTCPGILGTHPQIAEDRAGDLFLAAYNAGAIHALSQTLGETTWSAYTFGGVSVKDDSFGLSGAYEGSRRLALSCVITGEAAPSEWWSANGGVTWHRSIQ